MSLRWAPRPLCWCCRVLKHLYIQPNTVNNVHVSAFPCSSSVGTLVLSRSRLLPSSLWCPSVDLITERSKAVALVLFFICGLVVSYCIAFKCWILLFCGFISRESFSSTAITSSVKIDLVILLFVTSSYIIQLLPYVRAIWRFVHPRRVILLYCPWAKSEGIITCRGWTNRYITLTCFIIPNAFCHKVLSGEKTCNPPDFNCYSSKVTNKNPCFVCLLYCLLQWKHTK